VELGVLKGLDPIYGAHVWPGDIQTRARLINVDWDLEVGDPGASAPVSKGVDTEAMFVLQHPDMLLFLKHKVEGLTNTFCSDWTPSSDPSQPIHVGRQGGQNSMVENTPLGQVVRKLRLILDFGGTGDTYLFLEVSDNSKTSFIKGHVMSKDKVVYI